MSTSNPIDLAQSIPPAELAEVGKDRAWLDRLGMGASLACAVHCMFAPFLFLLLPVVGTVWAHPAVHWVLAALVLPLALWVIRNGYRKHKKRLTLIAAGIGAACIVAGLIAPMIYTSSLFSVNLPTLGLFHESLMPIAGIPCTESCCPTVTYIADAKLLAITFPPGGLITLIGSFALVLAHGTNLIACRCYHKKKACDVDAVCGCTT